MRRRIRLVALAGLGLLALLTVVQLGCSPNLERDPNENSGRDGERGRAILMALDEPVNDRVDYNDGDMTDWKLVQIPSNGTITVTLGCDYTGAWCGVNVRNEVGIILSALETRGEPRVQEQIQVPRGNYYLEIYASSAATDYTIEVEYESN